MKLKRITLKIEIFNPASYKSAGRFSLCYTRAFFSVL